MPASTASATAEAETRSPSRRALLAGALGGLGAWAASAIGRASPARADDGDPIVVGQSLSATSSTTLINTTTSLGVFSANSTSGYGLYGSSSSADAIFGVSTSASGVHGASTSSSGLRGQSDSGSGVYGTSASGSGVYGSSTATDKPGTVGESQTFTGVMGHSGPTSLPAGRAKTAVYGYADQDSNSKGIYGESPAGWAGYFAGKLYLSKYQEMKEISTPTAPGANKARLFVRDSGSGKTQLCVRFPTGAVQVIKTEP